MKQMHKYNIIFDKRYKMDNFIGKSQSPNQPKKLNSAEKK